MLKVKSFKIKDDKGINNLLLNYRLATGAHILITDGRVCIPYEDGLPPTKEQLISIEMEHKNTIQEKIDPMVHSQKVNQRIIDGVEAQIKIEQGKIVESEEILERIEATPKGEQKDVQAQKTAYITKKEAEGEIKRLQNIISQTETTMLLNQAEITRLVTNIQVYDETIAELNK